MQLLLLAPLAPCPAGNGLAMRVASFAEAATSDFDVHVAVVPVSGSLPRCPGDPPDVPVTIVPRLQRDKGRHQLAALVADPGWRVLLDRSEPMPPAARAASPALATEVLDSTAVRRGAALHVCRSYLAPLGLAVAERLASERLTLDLDDDDEAVARALGDEWSASAYHRLVAAFAHRYSAVCLASPAEAGTVGLRHGFEAVAVPNAVALPDSGVRRRARTGVLLFVGNLDYPPNVEAALVLVREVLPALQQHVTRPLRVLLVGGHDPDGPVAALASNPSVAVAGFVDDLRPCYEEAEVVVAPISSGGGTRIKLLEAFAHRVPVVTTPTGAAGLATRDHEHLLVATGAEELAAAVAEVLDDPVLAGGLAASALDYVRENHRPVVVARHVRSFLASGSVG